MPDVEAAVKEIVGTSGDADVLNYVISMLDDESFEFGDDAEEAFEAIGPLLVRTNLLYHVLLPVFAFLLLFSS
jgi:hypothetical protein